MKLELGTEEYLAWGQPVNGLRAAIAIRPAAREPKPADMRELYLAVQNVSNAPIRLSDTTKAPRLRELDFRRDGETLFRLVSNDPTLADVLLEPRELVFLLMFSRGSKDADGNTEGSALAKGVLRDTRETLVAELNIEHAAAGAWSGKLVTGETTGAVAVGQPQPKDKSARELFKLWQLHVRGNGKFPGGLVGRLGNTVKELIRLNTGDGAGDAFAKGMAPFVPRFDATRDWTAAEAVALLDDIAAISVIAAGFRAGSSRGAHFPERRAAAAGACPGPVARGAAERSPDRVAAGAARGSSTRLERRCGRASCFTMRGRTRSCSARGRGTNPAITRRATRRASTSRSIRRSG